MSVNRAVEAGKAQPFDGTWGVNRGTTNAGQTVRGARLQGRVMGREPPAELTASTECSATGDPLARSGPAGVPGTVMGPLCGGFLSSTLAGDSISADVGL
jgi:hypothetical protein